MLTWTQNRSHSTSCVCKIGHVLGDVLYGTDFSFVVGAITYVHTVLNIMIMMAHFFYGSNYDRQRTHHYYYFLFFII